MREIVSADIPQIRNLIGKVLGASEFKHIERLGGLTNHTYRIDLNDEQSYVIRLPGTGTEVLINRANEKISTQLACDLGIDTQMLYFGESGEKVTRYIPGAKTLNSDDFKDMDILQKAAEVLRILHTSGADTAVPFDVFDMAAGYEKIIHDNSVALFSDYEETKEKIMHIRDYVAKHSSASPVPCHNDPLCENWVLSADEKLHLIDWEYAGMNDGMWDLADVSIEAGLSKEQDDALLAFYYGRAPEQPEYIRFMANKLYLDFLWSLWGKTRVPFDGIAMEEYGFARYIRLKQNLSAFAESFQSIQT